MSVVLYFINMHDGCN